MKKGRAFVVLGCAFVFAACGGDSAATRIRVTVSEGDGASASLLSLRITTFATGEQSSASLQWVDLEEEKLPYEFTLTPKSGELSKEMNIRVDAYDAKREDIADESSPLLVGEQTVAWKKHATVRVDIVLGESADGGDDDAGDGGEKTYRVCPGADEGTKCPVPSYVGDDNWELLYAEGTKDLEVTAGGLIEFDTATGEVKQLSGDTVFRPADAEELDAESGIGFRVVPQADGAPGIGVFFVKSFTEEEGAQIVVTGKNALAVLSSEDIVISGGIQLDALGAVGGPGGRSGRTKYVSAAQHVANDGNAAMAPSGSTVCSLSQAVGAGGGGGNGGKGGKGGGSFCSSVDAESPGGAGGQAIAADEEPTLRGGGGGGPGLNINHITKARLAATPGGGGGGAVLFASATQVTIEATAVINASGAGVTAFAPDFVTVNGDSGAADTTKRIGVGAGGGAGGTIVIEAPSVEIHGSLTVNGGGGQGADSRDTYNTDSSETGRLDQTAAEASAGVGSVLLAAGNGGAGSDAFAPNGKVGETPAVGGGTDATWGGGGGGGAGWLIVRTLVDNFEDMQDPEAVLSPAEGTPLSLSQKMQTVTIH